MLDAKSLRNEQESCVFSGLVRGREGAVAGKNETTRRNWVKLGATCGELHEGSYQAPLYLFLG